VPTRVRVYLSRATAACRTEPPYGAPADACRSDADCGAGGFCAGLLGSPDAGFCQPLWMRGTFSMPEAGQLSAPLPRGDEWHRVIFTVHDLATVPMDAWLQPFVDGIPAGNVEFRLYNPSGTVSSTLVGLTFGMPQPLWVPGDESVNGEWVLEIRDRGDEGQGYFRGARLSLTSRYD
jgi:hypothetical protein